MLLALVLVIGRSFRALRGARRKIGAREGVRETRVDRGMQRSGAAGGWRGVRAGRGSRRAREIIACAAEREPCVHGVLRGRQRANDACAGFRLRRDGRTPCVPRSSLRRTRKTARHRLRLTAQRGNDAGAVDPLRVSRETTRGWFVLCDAELQLRCFAFFRTRSRANLRRTDSWLAASTRTQLAPTFLRRPAPKRQMLRFRLAS